MVVSNSLIDFNDNESSKSKELKERTKCLSTDSKKKDVSKSLMQIKTSRLRTASIISPTDRPGSSLSNSRRPGLGQSDNTPLRQKSSMSSNNSTCQISSKDKDKLQKRGNKLIDFSNEKLCETNHYDKKLNKYIKSNSPSSRRVNVFNVSSSNESYDCKDSIIRGAGNTCTSVTKRKNSLQTGSQRSGEVSDRVDALTALTKATIERVQKLTSSPINNNNHKSKNLHDDSKDVNDTDINLSTTPLKSRPTVKKISEIYGSNSLSLFNSSSILKTINNEVQNNNQHQLTPISILKHKSFDIETSDECQSTSGKIKHGILKKRSSLDENKILRRRSYSPDFYVEINNYEFRPILKNERRSSLDELVKRSTSPTSILKRKSSESSENDIGLMEPQSILKRPSNNTAITTTALNIIPTTTTNTTTTTTATITATTTVTTTTTTAANNNNNIVDSGECSNGFTEVRPILKKKISREESSSSDQSSLEPRPILKKKSSTDLDEHDDKPKKTILKSSRKSSEESNNEFESLSPKKLSLLKNPSLQRRTNSLPECDNIRPILKNSSTERSRSNILTSKDPCLRKRARSVGHENTKVSNKNLTKIDNEYHFTHSSSSSSSSSSIPTSLPPPPQPPPLLSSSSPPPPPMSFNVATPIVSFKLPNRQEYDDDDDDDYEEEEEEEIIYNESNAKGENAEHEIINNSANYERLSEGAVKSQRNACHFRQRELLNISNENQMSKNHIIIEDKRILNSNEKVKVGKFCKIEKFQANEMIQQVGKKNDSSQMGLVFKEDVEYNMKDNNISESNQVQIFNSTGRQQIKSRFNTQPITYQEVQQAVLYNKLPNNIFKRNDGDDDDDDEDEDYGEDVGDNSDIKFKNEKIIVPSVSKSKYYDDSFLLRNCVKENTFNCEKLRRKSESESIKRKDVHLIHDNEIISSHSSNFQNMNSISERLAALQRGSTEWKRRVPLPIFLENQTLISSDSYSLCQKEKNELMIKQQKLSDRLEKLESATEGWRKRVTVPDCNRFTVSDKMRIDQSNSFNLQSKFLTSLENSSIEHRKRIQLESPLKKRNEFDIEYNDDDDDDYDDDGDDKDYQGKDNKCLLKTQHVPKTDDETFTSFFDNLSIEKCKDNTININESDFDIVTNNLELLNVQKSNVKVQRRRVYSKNPLKSLAARTDLKNEYTEINLGVADRVMKMTNIEKIGKNSTLAAEALAGLASTENFSSVKLKNVKDDDETNRKLLPYKDLMLILIKGRRHVQVRLVEPVANSINSGDNYILIRKNELYHYIGKYSNIIERSKANEIAVRIKKTKDLGCRATKIITINEDDKLYNINKEEVINFWKLLGITEPNNYKVKEAGHPDEDELYESALIHSNIVYEVTNNNKLIPIDKYWSNIPKIKMLDPNKVFIFDFGSEMYIWSGKIASVKKKKNAITLGEKLWNNGYDYNDNKFNPINSSNFIGGNNNNNEILNNNLINLCDIKRPDWCLFCKLNQHMETIIFCEKFFDWPTAIINNNIKLKTNDYHYDNNKIIIEPPDVNLYIQKSDNPVDLIIEGSHLGRGDGWFDDEFNRQTSVITTDISVWHIDEYSYYKLNNESIGQFYSNDSYIIRWMYTIKISGRELSGLPSKHMVEGRNRCVYFIWQGKYSSLNKQGTAALLTVELDKEEGPQIRIVQGSEPPAFLNLFNGGMVIHLGKKIINNDDKNHLKKMEKKTFICRGINTSETYLIEVSFSARQLRTRASLIFVNINNNKNKITITIWHGKNSLSYIRKLSLHAANKLKENHPIEAGFNPNSFIEIVEINEGEEPSEFFKFSELTINTKLYSTLSKKIIQHHTPRLFHFSSVSGEFIPTEILCPHRSSLDVKIPFPFLQEELYQVNQPALFLLDNNDELWIWQGWWPDGRSYDQAGTIRWQAERKSIMMFSVEYWKKLQSNSKKCSIYLIWAGLEPLDFVNLFPTWTNDDEIAELNIRDGHVPGEILSVESELARLMKSTYPPAQLFQRPLPEGVDPTTLELYLSPQHFQELLGMKIDEFKKLPMWKQIDIKKKIGLF